MMHKTHDAGHSRCAITMNLISCCAQQSPSIQKHQKRKSNKIKLLKIIAFEPNGPRHSANDALFEKNIYYEQ